MNLQPAPMQMIRSGQKTIELRLYDEKRRKNCRCSFVFKKDEYDFYMESE